MFSTVIIGNSQTEVINGKLVTPRGYKLYETGSLADWQEPVKVVSD